MLLLLTLINQLLPIAAANALPLDDQLRLNDITLTLMMPHVQKAVNDFYKPYLTLAPTVATYYDSQIVNIDGGEHMHEGVYNSHYTITVEVYPYIGPHLSVGKDRIVLNVNPGGVTLKKYEHLESHALPPHYQSIIKQPLP